MDPTNRNVPKLAVPSDEEVAAFQRLAEEIGKVIGAALAKQPHIRSTAGSDLELDLPAQEEPG